MYWLMMMLRTIHIVSAMTAVGGAIFMRFALLPSVAALSDEHRKLLHEQVRSRWAKLVAASIALLLISGLVNFFLFRNEYLGWGELWPAESRKIYNIVFGIKFLLAMVIFFIASAIAGKSAATQKLRDNAKFWITVNVLLAIVVVALSGVLRLTHNGPPAKPAASVTTNSAAT